MSIVVSSWEFILPRHTRAFLYPSVFPLLLYFTLFFTSSPCLSLSVCLAHTLTHTVVSLHLLSSSISNSLRHRLYSSCLRHPGKLHFVFNVVEFPACSGRPAGRRGLCTGWLFDLINPVLVFPEKAESSGSSALPKVMSTVEKELKLDRANVWTLGLYWYISWLISAHICEYKRSGAITLVTPHREEKKGKKTWLGWNPVTPYSVIHFLPLFCFDKKGQLCWATHSPSNITVQEVVV